MSEATPGSDTDYSQQRFPAGQQGGYAGNTSDTNTFGAGGDFGSTRATTGQHSTQRGQNEFAGNTTDGNTFGAGGDFRHTGSQAGQQRGFRNEGPGGDSWEQEGSGGQGRKPTMGERVKGPSILIVVSSLYHMVLTYGSRQRGTNEGVCDPEP